MKIYCIALFTLLILLLSACGRKLNISKLKLDKQNNFYTYKRYGVDLAVRNPDNTLVTQENLENFLRITDSCNYRYDMNQISEFDYLVNREEATLVNLYSGIIVSLNLRNRIAAFYFLNEFKKLMPQYYKYSDVEFLEGKSWELDNNIDSAKNSYAHFLKFSSGKYSAHFRGYTLNDSSKIAFSNERKYAIAYLTHNQKNTINTELKAITPKYYYQSFSPGYVVNREDIGFRSFFLPGFSLMGSTAQITYWGLNTTLLFNEQFVLYLAGSWSDFQRDYLISAPYQLYKSVNNRFGIKTTPMLYANIFRKTDHNPNITGPYVNFGLGISAGYQLNHKFSIGFSYLGFFYNQYYHRKIENTDNEIYLNNEYDISIYYQLLKSISLKAGIDNGNVVTGIVFTGSFLGYNSQNKGVSYKFTIH